jgi:hypothetical protein
MSSLGHKAAYDVTPGHVGPRIHDAFASFVRMLGAVAWSMALAVIGLWVLLNDSLPGFLSSLGAMERMLVGIGMLCGGQLVFLHFVAERIFTRTPRVLSLRVHWVLVGMGALCVVLVIAGRMMNGGLA